MSLRALAIPSEYGLGSSAYNGSVSQSCSVTPLVVKQDGDTGHDVAVLGNGMDLFDQLRFQ